MEHEFFASCLAGLEQALAAELKTFGIDRVRPLGGGVSFFCAPAEAYRACLWSRLASRIALVLGRVNAADADLLYAGVYDIAWEDILAEGSTIAVHAHGTNDQLRNTRFTALKVKDALVDRVRAKRDERPQVDTASPRTSIDVRVRANRATISLDFSGEALNHRSYLSRDDGEEAALECSLAAGMLALAGWPHDGEGAEAFLDPVCGDGFVLVEAASAACDQAPGLARERWGFMGWSGFAPSVWEELLAEADERFEQGLSRFAGAEGAQASVSTPPDLARVRFAGASTSSPAIKRARDHVRRAGLRQVASVELADAQTVGDLVKRIVKAAGYQATCFVASNLDARSRSDARAHVQADESTFVAACTAAPEGSRFAVMGAQGVEARFGVQPASTATVGRGRVETDVAVFEQPPLGGILIEIADLAGGAPHKVEVLEAASSQFAARLRKVFKERRKWAAGEGVSCYRIYDADLSDYSVAIDVYTGAGDAKGNIYLHIAEYAPPASVDAAKAQRRFDDVLAIAPVVCSVRPDHVFAKTRMHDKGGAQYRNAGQRTYITQVQEAGHLFEVDLASRLDTGLFLDHRITRALVGERAQGARFCNLFAYTGTASVYAAAGGAASTTTVDLSQTYLEWAERNMRANGFGGREHRYVRRDVMRWLNEARERGERFDLMFVDPPTFSNSKAMGKRTWDVQRDHFELLIRATRLLDFDGELVFSCNLRTFKPDYEKLERYGIVLEDISLDTIPEDFARTPRIHKCYLVHRER